MRKINPIMLMQMECCYSSSLKGGMSYRGQRRVSCHVKTGHVSQLRLRSGVRRSGRQTGTLEIKHHPGDTHQTHLDNYKNYDSGCLCLQLSELWLIASSSFHVHFSFLTRDRFYSCSHSSPPLSINHPVSPSIPMAKVFFFWCHISE